jgi:hypothetical protein
MSDSVISLGVNANTAEATAKVKAFSQTVEDQLGTKVTAATNRVTAANLKLRESEEALAEEQAKLDALNESGVATTDELAAANTRVEAATVKRDIANDGLVSSNQKLSKAESDLKAGEKDVGEDAEKGLKGAAGGAGNFLSSLTGLSPAMLGAAAVGGSLALVAKGVFEEFERTQAATIQLTNSMKDNGEKVTPAFMKSLKAVQSAGDDLGFSQDQTTASLAAMSLAGLTQKQAMAQLPQLYDLARAKGMSLADATTTLTKGLMGSARGLKDMNIIGLELVPSTAAIAAGVTKLAALNVKATEAQEDYTKACEKYGDASKEAVAAKQKEITAEANLEAQEAKTNTTLNIAAVRAHNLTILHDALAKKVGGAAAAATHTLGVEWDIAKDKFNAFAGQAIPYVQAAIATFLGWVSTAVSDVMGFFNKNASTFRTIFKIAGQTIGIIIGDLVTVFKVGFGIIKGVINVVATTIGVISTIISGVVTAVRIYIGILVTIFTVEFNIIKGVVTVAVNIIEAIVGGISTAISGVISFVGGVVGAVGTVFGKIRDAIKIPIGIITGIISGLQGAWTTVMSFFSGAVTNVTTVFGNIATAIKNVFLAPFRFIAQLWNETFGKIKVSIPGWVPVIGGKTFGFPQIPNFSSGGVVPGSGSSSVLASVEPGEVIMNAAQQSSVASALTGGSAAKGGTVINVYVTTNANPNAIGRAIAQGQRLRTRTA